MDRNTTAVNRLADALGQFATTIIASLTQHGAALDRNTAAVAAATQEETIMADDLTRLSDAESAESAELAKLTPAVNAVIAQLGQLTSTGLTPQQMALVEGVITKLNDHNTALAALTTSAKAAVPPPPVPPPGP